MVLIKEVTTHLHACSIESCKGDVFFCGTYELNEETRDRQGEIIAFHNEVTIHTTKCESGVLDMKVAHGKLVAVLSTGRMEIYRIVRNNQGDGPAVALQLETSVSDEAEGLFLSVDIDSRLQSDCWNVPTRLIVSTQQGSIIIYEYTIPENNSDTGTHGMLSEIYRVSSAHNMMGEDMPAWIVFFDPHCKTRVISGGDDLCLNVWTLPASDTSDEETLTKTATNRKTHTAGVTSGQWHPTLLNIFATGSYDEYVRVWDVQNITKPLLEIHTGGGLWRVKWVVPQGSGNLEEAPQDHFLVLAGMHGGCHIYRLRVTLEAPVGEQLDSATSSVVIEVIGGFHHTDERNDKHLAYGIDVLSCTENGPSDASFRIASCSFYDNLVQIWSGSV